MVTRRTIGGQIVSSICNTFGRFQIIFLDILDLQEDLLERDIK